MKSAVDLFSLIYQVSSISVDNLYNNSCINLIFEQANLLFPTLAGSNKIIVKSF
jgi:hypothetical protein